MQAIQSPALPEVMAAITDLSLACRTGRETEEPVTGARAAGLSEPGGDFSEAQFAGVVFERCRLSESSFMRASFTDAVFRDCDLSACDFSVCYFNRCRFEGCKGMGANFFDTRIHQTAFGDCNLKYLAVTGAKLTGVRISGCDMSGADINECRLKDAAFHKVRLDGASFFKTPLKGIDLTSCQLPGLRVSAGFGELRGAVVDMFQAAELAKLLGVVVR